MNTSVPLWVTLLTVLIALLAVLVHAVAIYFTRNNLFKQISEQREMMERQFSEQRESLNKQMKMQLATTVLREWIETMRKTLAQTLHTGMLISNERTIYKTLKGDEKEKSRIQLNEYTTQIKQIGSLFQAYINFDDPIEKKFYDAIDIHIRRSSSGNFDEVNDYNESYKSVLFSFKEMINEKQII